MHREPAPGESAEALLLELRAQLLLEQRRQLRSQRRGFARIAQHAEYQFAELMRTSADWPDAMADYRRQRAALANAIERTDAALEHNAEALAAPVRDAWLLIEHNPDDLLDTVSRARQRVRSRTYQANLRELRLATKDGEAA